MKEAEEIWFVCNEENAEKIIKVLIRHGLKMKKGAEHGAISV